MSRDDDLAALGLGPDADDDDVRRAWRRVVATTHPDAIERAGVSDPRARERLLAAFRRADEARERLLAARAPARPPAPAPTRPVLSLELEGPIAWRGGQLDVALPDGRASTLVVPPGVRVGQVLELADAEALARVTAASVAPWRERPRDDGHAPDLLGDVDVSLWALLTGASVDLPTPWGPMRARLPARQTSIRVGGAGHRPPGRPAGDLVLELRPTLPPSGDALLELALQRHDHPPRLR